MDKGKKLAVLVGCNYPNTKNALHGCHNDVLSMRDLLIKRFGFDPKNVELLTDKPGSLVMPTGANIMKALHQMVDQAQSGDVLYFHYSGHGTLIDKPFLPFSKKEAIVPTDFNLITNWTRGRNARGSNLRHLSEKRGPLLRVVHGDNSSTLHEIADVDFRHLVNRVPKEASFTVLSDSCHSGGLIDKEKEQIGPSKNHLAGDSSISYNKPKAIPYESVLKHLSSLTNINTTDIGTHLLEVFGADASLSFRLPRVEIDFFKPLKQDEGILLSGCQTDETSADVISEKGKAYGAFSNAVQNLFKENSGPLTNREVVSMARKILMMQQFEQHPCLYCSDENADAGFLSPSATAASPST